MPTSITLAPSRTCSAFTKFAWPIAAIKMSADRVISFEIAAARVHDRDRRVRVFVLLHEKQGERFAHDHAAANDHDVRAGDVDPAFNQQALATERGAWDKSAGIADCELRHIHRMKTIDIFAGSSARTIASSSICFGGGDCTRIP